ncbi:low molecular weight protein-tyrosine-phosphatase [Algihabitans albus]|uniref:low molecular weight protein-tyrosine-phosphatase n=1 Tax=Algihabitans albus TaxID=2164067 RepID=UPI001F385BAE|nr:low molecular weight protein-tyrosine-phosphatase [Algihabitans albus]
MSDPRDEVGRQGQPQSLLFVCSGNICRSPSAEGVMRKLLDDAGLTQVRTGSVGTGGWHVGDPPDKRARDAAARRGYDLSALRAEQLADWHFQDFDRLYAMDLGHLRHMRARVPATLRSRVRLYLHPLDPEAAGGREVPDPYYGDLSGFEDALDIVEAGAREILTALQGGRL